MKYLCDEIASFPNQGTPFSPSKCGKLSLLILSFYSQDEIAWNSTENCSLHVKFRGKATQEIWVWTADSRDTCLSDHNTALLNHYLVPCCGINQKCHSTEWKTDPPHTPPSLHFLADSYVSLLLTLFSVTLKSSYFQKPTRTLDLSFVSGNFPGYVSTLFYFTPKCLVSGA